MTTSKTNFPRFTHDQRKALHALGMCSRRECVHYNGMMLTISLKGQYVITNGADSGEWLTFSDFNYALGAMLQGEVFK